MPHRRIPDQSLYTVYVHFVFVHVLTFRPLILHISMWTPYLIDLCIGRPVFKYLALETTPYKGMIYLEGGCRRHHYSRFHAIRGHTSHASVLFSLILCSFYNNFCTSSWCCRLRTDSRDVYQDSRAWIMVH